MTIDDESSIYVGGLPYDATEDSLRSVFDIYGSVVAVKIINDHGVGGKCYGFVTFTNPRSAIHAIADMDGRMIDGRVVKVNEVKARGGRSNFVHEGSRRNTERGGWDRDKDRGRDYDHDRDRYRDRHRDRSRDHGQERERGHDRARDNARTRDRFVDRDRDRGQDQDRAMEDIEQEHEKKREQDWKREKVDQDRDRVTDRTNSHHKNGDNDKDQKPKLSNGSQFIDRRSREISSESSDEDRDQVEKQLEISNQKLGELQEEISRMEELAEEKRELILKLHQKSQKLEDALTAAKKLTSHRQMQLAKLHKCFLQVKDYSNRLKSCEQELQSLVDSTMTEVGFGDDVGVRDGILANDSVPR